MKVISKTKKRTNNFKILSPKIVNRRQKMFDEILVVVSRRRTLDISLLRLKSNQEKIKFSLQPWRRQLFRNLNNSFRRYIAKERQHQIKNT